MLNDKTNQSQCPGDVNVETIILANVSDFAMMLCKSCFSLAIYERMSAHQLNIIYTYFTNQSGEVKRARSHPRMNVIDHLQAMMLYSFKIQAATTKLTNVTNAKP
jgi:hypothetical protein